MGARQTTSRSTARHRSAAEPAARLAVDTAPELVPQAGAGGGASSGRRRCSAAPVRTAPGPGGVAGVLRGGHGPVRAAALRLPRRAPPGRPRRFDARFLLADAASCAGQADDLAAAGSAHLQWLDLGRGAGAALASSPRWCSPRSRHARRARAGAGGAVLPPARGGGAVQAPEGASCRARGQRAARISGPRGGPRWALRKTAGGTRHGEADDDQSS